MPIEDELAKGDKIDTHIWLYRSELEVIDAICAKYDCSRSSVIAAFTREYKDTDLAGKVKPGRRPGGGRKPMQR